MDEEIKEVHKKFDQAIELSRKQDALYVGVIAYNMQLPKSYFEKWAEKDESLAYKLELILTNCEAMIFSELKYKRLDPKVGALALESNHGWGKDNTGGNSVTIKVEGVTNNELDDLLEE